MSLSIKLVFGNEIHRLSQLPESYAALQEYCSSLFHYPQFHVTYQDEEGDKITIACDSDLKTAYSTLQPGQSLRFFLSLPTSSGNSTQIPRPPTSERFESDSCASEASSQSYQSQVVWPRHTCDGCNTKPIIGARFHCTVCDDFDFCSNCESSLTHEHPFMKFASRNEDVYVNIDFTPENLFGSLMKVKNFLFNQLPKMTVKDTVIQKTPSNTFRIIWIVCNSGSCTWPSGCTAINCKNNLPVTFLAIPELQPGQSGEIIANLSYASGKLNSKWKIVTPHGLKVGKLSLKTFVEANDDRVDRLIEMGCDPTLAQEVLSKANGDLQQALRILFP